MIKNKFNFFIFSMAFFMFLVFLICTPATEESNKFISGLCLGFLLSQVVFLFYVNIENSKEDNNLNDINNNHKKDNYLNDYWWNDGKKPNFKNNCDED